jgi:uncharacterized OB-fold protein
MSEGITSRLFSSASFDQYINEYKLMAARCTQCGGTYIPPRAICPKCHSDQLEWVESSGKGSLAAFTVIYNGPTFMLKQGFGRTRPYISGIVMLDEGTCISARITGIDPTRPDLIKIGTPLMVDFVEFGESEGSLVQGAVQKTWLAFRPL